VYYNAEKNEAIINHRGSQGMVDWLYNAAYMYGGEDYYKLTPRYYEAKKAQEATEKKYGSENTITIGHSSGGLLSELLGKNSKQIITLNKAARPVFFPKIKHKNQLDIRSKCDIISAGGYYDKQIECSSADILAEHKTDILDRIGDKMVGEGSIFSRPNPARVEPVDDRREFDESQARDTINRWIADFWNGFVRSEADDRLFRDFAYFILTDRGGEVLRNVFHPREGRESIIPSEIWREEARTALNALLETYPDDVPTDDESDVDDSEMEGTGKNNFSRDSIDMNFSHLTPNALANMKHHIIRPDGRRIDDSRFTIPDSRFFQERPRKRFMRGRGLVAESGMSGMGMGKNPAEPMIKNPQTQHAVQIPEKGAIKQFSGRGLVAEGSSGEGLVAEGEGMCGTGMCGTGKHKKGSAEMKEKMAKLRAMRKKK
jgi:hypothetical protein